VALLGMAIEVKEEQSAKVPTPISVTFSGIVMDVRAEQ
jgi:hypothetical protein